MGDLSAKETTTTLKCYATVFAAHSSGLDHKSVLLPKCKLSP
jgi:hypothetical protein